jgi:predicted enzyme related to lactoylglutathione lyase
MKRVTGLGGIFFKSEDPEKLYTWYEEHLGLKRDSSEAVVFKWRDLGDEKEGRTVWGIFAKSSKYFDPSPSQFMLNFRVDDLDALLAALRAEGVKVDEKIEEYDYGRFAWIMDPEGNRIELWEPPK